MLNKSKMIKTEKKKTDDKRKVIIKKYSAFESGKGRMKKGNIRINAYQEGTKVHRSETKVGKEGMRMKKKNTNSAMNAKKVGNIVVEE